MKEKGKQGDGKPERAAKPKRPAKPKRLRGQRAPKGPKSVARPGRATALRGPQKRSELTRQNILEAALRLIARDGLGAVRMRAVANEAGVSLGVTTYHFPSRGDLLMAAFSLHLSQTDAAGADFSERFGAAWRADAISLDGLTDAVVQLLSRFVHEERDSFIASHELTLELTRDPALASRVQDALSLHHRSVVQMVEAVGSSEPELDADILSAALQGLALKWLARPNDRSFKERLRRVVRRLMERLLADRLRANA
jgi:AcrR family transcriptional regulator